MSQRFKVGDIVKCIDNSNFEDLLVKGRVYKIKHENNFYVNLEEVEENIGFMLDRFELFKNPKELIKPQFKVGDIVEAFGCRGVVDEIRTTANTYPVCVRFNSSDFDWFTEDGRCRVHYKTPSLVFVSRPKKKVTKTVEAWANVYSDGSRVVHVFKDKADEMAVSNRIACVKLTGTYEVEVEQED